MVATLCVAKVDLNWAEDQYWSTLFNVIGDLSKIYTKKEKRKLKASEANRFVK